MPHNRNFGIELLIMTIEVFKTNVVNDMQAQAIRLLLQHFPGSRINFDLHDCDKVLRMEGTDFTTEKVILLVNQEGVFCNVLD